MNTETSPKLIQYLVKKKHWSPLEMVDVTVEVTTTRDIARQILRHRSFVFQEFCISGESLITTKAGNYIPIKRLFEKQNYKQYKNIPLRVYDEETGFFTYAPLKEVFKTGKKECYKVNFSDGKTIICTKEHKFLTKEGFKTLETALGMEAHGQKITFFNPLELAVNGEPAYRSYEWLKEARDKANKNKIGAIGIAEELGVQTHTIRKWLKRHGLEQPKRKRRVTIPVWNKGKTGYKIKPRTREQKEYMRSITPKGEFHHAFKGSSSRNEFGINRAQLCNFFTTHRKDIFEKFDYKCQMCFDQFNKFDGKIDIHHIKEVSLYPELAYELSNVIPVHRKCYMEHHSKTYNYKNRKKHKGNILVPKFKKINSVEYVGFLDTYDLEVEHSSHNYVANKIVVHNSQRYANPTDMPFEVREARLQDTKNRQNSIEVEDTELDAEWARKQIDIMHRAQEVYKWASDKGIAKEVSRSVMPEGMTQSVLYVKGSLRSWTHYLDLRTGIETQKEHRLVAAECAKVISEVVPTMFDIYNRF